MYIAGIDVGGTNLKFGIFDEQGKNVYTQVTRSVRGDSVGCARQIKQMIDEAPYPVRMIGCGVPGTVFREQGTVNSGNLKWSNVPFEKVLTQETGLPVWIDNDAQCALMAETLEGGSCFGLSDAVYLTLGTGVGGALLINGRPWRGHNNAGGELGHFITHAGGLSCPCGQRGCFEMYASAGALSRYANGVRARTVLDEARKGNRRMFDALGLYCRELANGIVSLYMIFHPQAVVLGGGLSAAGNVLLERIPQYVRSGYDVNPEIIKKTLRLATNLNDAGMAGAAALARLNLN